MIRTDRRNITATSQNELARIGREVDPSIMDFFSVGAGDLAFTQEGGGYEDFQYEFTLQSMGQSGGAISEEWFNATYGVYKPEADLSQENKPLSREDYEQSPYFREELKYMDGLTTWAADNRAAVYDRKQRALEVASRAEGFVDNAALFAGTLAGSILDLKNVAVGTAITTTGTVATAGLGAIPSAGAGVIASTGRAFYKARNAWRATQTTRPIATTAATTAGVSVATTLPQVATGIRNEPVFATEYGYDDAAIDLAASAALDLGVRGAAGYITNRFFQRNALPEEIDAIEQLEVAQYRNGEEVNTTPLKQAIMLRDPPEYTSVNFVEEKPKITKREDGMFEARFENETGLMEAHNRGVGKSRASAEADLKTKYMAEEIPQDIIRDVGDYSLAAQLRELAIMKNDLDRRGFAIDAEEVIQTEGMEVPEELRPIRDQYLSEVGRYDQARENLRLRPNSLKRQTEVENAKSRLTKLEKQYQDTANQVAPDLALRVRDRKQQQSNRLNMAEADTKKRAKKLADNLVQDFVSKQTNPEQLEASEIFEGTRSLAQKEADAKELQRVVNDPAATEARRQQARLELETRVESPNYPNDLREQIIESLKQVEDERSINSRLIEYHFKITQTGTFDGEDIFPEGTSSREVYNSLREMIDNLEVGEPLENRAEIVASIVDDFIADIEEDLNFKEVALLGRVKAIEDNGMVFNNLMEEGGKSAHEAFSATISRIANSIQRERGDAVNTLAFAFKSEGLDRYFVRLSRSKNRDESIKFLKEINNVENGGTKTITGSEQAFKAARIYKTLDDHYRFRAMQAGLRVRNLKDFTIRRSWNRDSLLRYRKGDADAFVEAMIDRLDDERMFGRKLSEGEKKMFLKDFHRKILTDERDADLSNRSLYSAKATVYKRSLDSREIHLKSEEDEMFVIENFSHGSVPTELTHAIVRRANEARLSETLGVGDPETTYNFLLQNRALPRADTESQKVLGGEGYKDLKGLAPAGTPGAEMALINVNSDYQYGDQTLATAYAAFTNFIKMAYMDATVLVSLSDVGFQQNARRRVSTGLRGRERRKISRSIGNAPKEIKDATLQATQHAAAFEIGTLLGQTSGGGLFKLQNMTRAGLNFVMKIGGMNWFTSHSRKTAHAYMASYVANTVDVPFELANTHARNVFIRAGITAQEYKKFKKYVRTMPNGTKSIDQLAMENADRALHSKYRDVMYEFVNDAVPTAGTREQATLGLHKKINDLGDVKNTFATMFMTFPVAMYRRQLAREFDVGVVRGTWATTQLALKMTALGAVIQAVIEESKGHDLEYDNPETWAYLGWRGFLNTVGGVIIGQVMVDSLLYGDALINAVGGVPGAAIDDQFEGIVGGAFRLATDENYDIDKYGAELIRLGKQFIPLLDQPLIRSFVNQEIYYPLLEELNPDRLEAMERRFEEATGGGEIVPND